MKTNSLQRYLLTRLGAIVLALAILLGSLLAYLLFYSHDDSAEYYMQYEGITLAEAYQFGDEIVEFDPQVKEYYWQKSDLPHSVNTLLAAQSPIMNKLNWVQTKHYDIYVLPHVIGFNSNIDTDKTEQILWVVHYFAKDDLGDTFYFNRNLSVWFTLGFVALLLLAVVMLSMSIGRQLQAFATWVNGSSVSNSSVDGTSADKPSEQVLTAPNFDFDELQQAAIALASSINAERQLQAEQLQQVDREKAFLSTLSHELRTPMAVINAAIALMTKRGDLSAKNASTLGKLNSANDKMKLLSTTLLALWRKQDDAKQDDAKQSSAEQTFTLKPWVAQAIDGAKLLHDINVQVEVSVSEKAISEDESWQALSINGRRALLQLVLDNLLRNSAQYSADGQALLNIDIQDGQLARLTVSNRVDIKQSNDNSSDECGYGLGLYLVNEICEQQGWHWSVEKRSVENTNDKFIALIFFTESPVNVRKLSSKIIS